MGCLLGVFISLLYEYPLYPPLSDHFKQATLIKSDGPLRRPRGASFPSVGVVGEKGGAEWVWSDEEHREHRGCYLSHSSTADVFLPTRQTIDLCYVAIKTFTKQT